MIVHGLLLKNTIIGPKKCNTSLILDIQIYYYLIKIIKKIPWVVCFGQDPNQAPTLQLGEDSQIF